MLPAFDWTMILLEVKWTVEIMVWNFLNPVSVSGVYNGLNEYWCETKKLLVASSNTATVI